ncbi:hypothetical protein, partial [Flagellimonas nanhaiensis]
GTSITVTDAGGTLSQDLDGTFATDAELAALNTDDADADPTNEYNTGSGITAGSVEITDAGGTESVNLISADANNDISAGTDGALYLNVASVSISETNTSLSFDSGTGQLTYTNELGNNPVVDLSSLEDDADADPTNEYNTAVGLTGTSITVTDAGGTLSQDLDGTFATDAELAAL